jgi:Icc-related predicted phosphoesterase
MRCLLVADLHYDLRKFDWVLAAAAAVDVVALAGDHLDAAASVGRSTQAIVVQKYFARIRERAVLLVCSGNHDLDHRDSRGVTSTRWIARTRHLDVPTDGDSPLLGDTLFSICPWSDGHGPRRPLLARLERDAARRPARWIWLHHAPPAGSPTSWDGRRCRGDPVLRVWIEQLQPDIVLCGHVHQSPFTPDGAWADRIGRSWVFNAGHQLGPVPAHVVVDTERPGAWWCSLAATEGADLAAAPVRPFAPVPDPPAWLLAMARPADPPPG